MSDGNNFTGIKYAFDKDDTRQYAIVFVSGRPTAVHMTAESASERTPPRNETRETIDDEGECIYKITFDQTGKPNRIQMEPAPGVFHPKTQQGAFLARNLVPNVQIDKQPPAPRNPYEDRNQGGGSIFDALFGTGNDNGQWPAPRPQRPTTRPTRPTTRPTTRPDNNTGNNNSGGAVVQPPPVRYKIPDRTLDQLLGTWGTDFTEQAYHGQLDPVIGREEERQKLKQYLLRKNRSSVCLIGEPGVGKSAMYHALAQDIIAGDAPDELADATVISLDLSSMNAGTKYRGEFEQRLLPILQGLQERKGLVHGRQVILCIDELHSALTAGKAEGGTNAGELMKPYLTSGAFKVIGATTIEEHKKHIEPNKALDRRFQPLLLDPPGTEDTIEILRGLCKIFEEHHKLTTAVTEEQIEYIVQMTDRHVHERFQPDKAIGVMDDAGAIARMRGSTAIERADIIQAVAKAGKTKPEFLDQDDDERFAKLPTELPKRVLGQDDQLAQICRSLAASRAGLRDPSLPRGAFLMQGPTGVGKTETAYALGDLLDMKVIRIDMANYGEKHSASGLRGAPPGYVGYDSHEPELTEQVRQNPYCILVLDEIEKAHADVFDLLLSILDKGEAKDAKGRTVRFDNVILLMTSNLGAKEAMLDKAMGFEDAASSDPKSDAVRAKRHVVYKKKRDAHFKPEFLNRVEMVGGCLEYDPLTKDIISNLIGREIQEVSKRLRENPDGIQLKDVELIEVTEKVKAALADHGYKPEYGARPLKSAVQRHLAEPLSLFLLENKKDITAKIKQMKGPAKILIDSLENFAPAIKAIKKATPAKPASP